MINSSRRTYRVSAVLCRNNLAFRPFQFLTLPFAPYIQRIFSWHSAPYKFTYLFANPQVTTLLWNSNFCLATRFNKKLS